jgi:hypothetical protein
MEDILISAARTIVDQSRRIDELEITVSELSHRLDMIEASGYSAVDRIARAESNLNIEKHKHQQFITDLLSAVNHYRNC